MSNVHGIVRAQLAKSIHSKSGPTTPPPTPRDRFSDPQTPDSQQPLLKLPHTSLLPTPGSSPGHGASSSDRPRPQPTICESEQPDATRAQSEEAPLETSSSVAPSLGSSRPSPARRAALETRHKGCGLRNPASVRRVNSAFKLIKELKDRKGTLRGGELYTWRKLLPTEYQELQVELESESEDLAAYFEEGLGYNYSATYKRLTICMPGPCHESMKEQLTDGIKNWYGLLKPETPYVDGQKVTCTEATRRATGSIESYGETQFPLKSNRTQSDLQADGSFRHGLGDVPHVILEVSWTQKPGDLLKKCNDWIRQSNGVVRTIIAFDLQSVILCVAKGREPWAHGKK
ncbi:hypothetical protein F5883DRAFT_584828 [Diaporthe sp. PMI_573]|nr:hypothetical protein F5883DRAFT_584828 [Diaporthaceae sp. PMI_573]